jgi:hypothetical protein
LSGGFVLGEIVGGNCPGGICPRVVLSKGELSSRDLSRGGIGSVTIWTIVWSLLAVSGLLRAVFVPFRVVLGHFGPIQIDLGHTTVVLRLS